MMKKPEKKSSLYTVNLVAIEGDDGAFPCPECGNSISPDDESETSYKIIDTKVVNDELAELVVACAKCGSTIHITGFQAGFDA